ncbi:MAG: amidase [Acidobacteria bacterium]|nr:amidase [Acidobacteriota bacterium]
MKKLGVSLVLTLGMVVPINSAQRVLAPADFGVEEATIAAIHAAFAAGRVTCVGLVQSYLKRIETYDDKGPVLNAVITINPKTLETAAQMDRLYSSKRSAAPLLHCIPVILKDNYDTADMPTTGGSLTLARSVPLQDAFVVKKLRDAGALILAKTNMTELALGGSSVSSLGGQTRNPYDLTRTPGGSSGGTGASIAANFGVIGTGSDTGQSVRSPVSAQSLVGIRPTRGLISRRGIIPASTTQDEAGPITRTVEDAARTLDVMAGYDSGDPITAFGLGKIPPTYTAFLDRNGLKGARIGVLVDFFGGDAVHQEVNAVMETAIEKMTDAGAAIVRINIPNLAETTRDIQLTEFEFKTAFNSYLASLGPRAPVKTLDEFIAGGEFHDSIKAALGAYQRVVDGLNSPEYKERLLRRHILRLAVMNVMAQNRLDAILYPHQKRLVVPIGEEQVDRNGVLSNSTGLPAITFPGGFSAPTRAAPLGVPVGMELLGPEWSEPILIKLAYAFEQFAKVRKPPASTPPLDR